MRFFICVRLILFIFRKYFELVTPNVDDYVYITDNTYSKEMILSTEMHILNIINWNLGSVLSLDFLDRYLLAMKADAIVKNLSNVRYNILTFLVLSRTYSSIL